MAVVNKEKDFFQISLKLIMKNNHGQILGLRGIKGGVYEGYYDLPGGRIDTDEFREPFARIISRELKEEIGNVKYRLDSRPVALGWHKGKQKVVIDGRKGVNRVIYICYSARYLGGKIKISAEHEGVAWLKLNRKNLNKYFYSGNLEVLRTYLGKT